MLIISPAVASKIFEAIRGFRRASVNMLRKSGSNWIKKKPQREHADTLKARAKSRNWENGKHKSAQSCVTRHVS